MTNATYNTYIGARYVPKFDGEWDNTKKYEPLIIVTYQGNSYTSKTYVPIGGDINDGRYWALTGNYNAQVEAYREEVATLQQSVNTFQNTVDDIDATTKAISATQLFMMSNWIDVTNPPAGLQGLTRNAEMDNAPILQAIIDYASTIQRRIVLYFPEGVYYFNTPVNLPQYCSLKGSGWLHTSLYVISSSESMFTCNGFNSISGLNVQNLDTSTTKIGFNVTGIQCSFDDVRVYNFRNCFLLKDAQGTKLRKVYMQSNVNNATGISASGRCVSSKFIMTTFVGALNTGASFFNYTAGNYCQDFLFDGIETSNVKYGIILSGGTTDYPSDNLITNSIFDTVLTSVLVINNFSNKGNVIFTNNWVNMGVVTENKNLISLILAENITISNNTITLLNDGGNTYVNAIYCSQCKNISVQGNIITNTAIGVLLSSSEGCLVCNNIFKNNQTTASRSAISTSNTDNCTYIGNRTQGLFNTACSIPDANSIVSSNYLVGGTAIITSPNKSNNVTN